MKSKQPNNNSLRCNYCWKHRQQDSAVTYQGYFPNAINVEEVRGDVALLFKQYIAKKLLATTRSTSNVLKVFQLVILLFVLIHQSATKCVNYNEGSTAKSPTCRITPRVFTLGGTIVTVSQSVSKWACSVGWMVTSENRRTTVWVVSARAEEAVFHSCVLSQWVHGTISVPALVVSS